MKSNSSLKLLGGLALAFVLPWLFVVLLPFIAESNAEPVPYPADAEVEGGITAYPDLALYRYGESDFGAKVYAAEGCIYCHTQMVRPTYAGPDMWRPGWGGREEDGLARETRPSDYRLEGVAPLGYQRIGQDLSNVGSRITSRELMHQHLLDPRSINSTSGMPAYKHLYRKSPFGKGMEPTPRAEALVDYLLSLKKDQPIPVEG